jgi:hypothetical protein
MSSRVDPPSRERKINNIHFIFADTNFLIK